ncbi:hypothetical protein [Rubellimicrobium aerolatum]|uniref:Uncharacterized protein n=1 Tax=Rubellimicrobium aerolatum TaxID=490979 RepID=A0ABW0SF06_9RHOB|nr:hypothetical protein [Rubellimicrobium aerolatum]MBP1806496.1 hypothetical protein [Rubellimicrobium aerolatum]
MSRDSYIHRRAKRIRRLTGPHPARGLRLKDHLVVRIIADQARQHVVTDAIRRKMEQRRG